MPTQNSTVGTTDHSQGGPFSKPHHKLEISLSDLFFPHAHSFIITELAFAFTETSSQKEQRRNVKGHLP